MTTIKPANLRIGDVIKWNMETGPFSHMTVVADDGETLKLFRVYVSLADFTYLYKEDGEQVISYIGHEDVYLRKDDSREVLLLDNVYREKL